ncbi:MAG: TIGR02710 family CRISPR-associated CARF protein [Thermodesulfobacteriota bacterium]
MVCKSNPAMKVPDLPNIPNTAGLRPDQFGVTIVLSDDLDQAFVMTRKKLIELTQRFPDAAIVADYTGGTKTMTAALVTAVLETDGINLQLVTGNRPDLIKVKNGTQSVASASIDALRYQKGIQPFASAWKRFAYDEAAWGLSAISPPSENRFRSLHFRFRDMSAAFAAWDRFDHNQALHLLSGYDRAVGPILGPYLAVLRILTTDGPKQEPMQILDLWQNALRRVVQGRFDDAMGRCYRTIEWTAQWILRKDHGIETTDVPADFIPESMQIIPSPDGRCQAGLMKAWELIRLKHGGPAKKLIETHGNRLRDLILLRNRSILAHGKEPIGEETWQKMADWMEQAFIPMLLEESTVVGIRKAPPQLPDDPDPIQGIGA